MQGHGYRAGAAAANTAAASNAYSAGYAAGATYAMGAIYPTLPAGYVVQMFTLQ
ncbi:hypothetical protein [Pantanalinema sp. GBBB05]|uniref:hypothetical protein n=1 Tax=Pantanalinema sp. GBBB05 TaxID=2604139 RepID=UPI003D819A7D